MSIYDNFKTEKALLLDCQSEYMRKVCIYAFSEEKFAPL